MEMNKCLQLKATSAERAAPAWLTTDQNLLDCQAQYLKHKGSTNDKCFLLTMANATCHQGTRPALLPQRSPDPWHCSAPPAGCLTSQPITLGHRWLLRARTKAALKEEPYFWGCRNQASAKGFFPLEGVGCS